MARDGCNCYFLFWAIFSFYPSNSPKDQNFKEMKKTPGDIIILRFTYDQMMYRSWNMVCNGRTERRAGKKVGAPPENIPVVLKNIRKKLNF